MTAGGYGSKIIAIKAKYPIIGYLISIIYPPSPTLNSIPKNKMNYLKKVLFNNGNNKVLNIGCGSNIGCGWKLWKNIKTNNVTNADIKMGKGVDIVADAHNLPFSDDTFDAIIMQAVVEHLHSPNQAIDEAYRVLKKGGYIYLEVPFLQGFHADPHDYQRYTLKGLEKLLNKYHKIELMGISVGVFCTFIWIIRDFMSNITKIKIVNYLLRFVFSWILAPFRYLDYLFYNTKASERLASEYYILAKK
jgi:SAM-dependent methyltransferase